MRKLKKSIVWIFLITITVLSFVESFVDFIFEDYAIPYYGVAGTYQTLIVSVIYILVSLLLIAVSAWVFSKIIGKKFEIEMHRQMDDRNMLYANIAHDLKTPMTSILGYAKALEDKKVEPEQIEVVSDRIYQKAKQINELLNMLFEYTKLQAESYLLNKTKADICAIVRNVAAGQYEAFEEKKIELDVDIPEDAIFFSCDVRQITRAVENLIINAYKHNEGGKRVGIILRGNEGKVSIIVADNGRDISQDEAGSIFDPFVSGDGSRNSSHGSGLGLAIASGIVKKHGGTLSIEHKEDGYVKEFVINLG